MKEKQYAEPVKTRTGWKCSKCKEPAYYDGRCGDGPVLLCKCETEADAWAGWCDR